MSYYQSSLFQLRLSVKELRPFLSMLPIVELGADELEKSKAMKVIGVDNELIFDLLKHHDEDLLIAFRIVLFALSLKDYPSDLAPFLRRIKFIDKGFEMRFKRMLGRSRVREKIVSAKELNGWWGLDSKYDDGGQPINE